MSLLATLGVIRLRLPVVVMVCAKVKAEPLVTDRLRAATASGGKQTSTRERVMTRETLARPSSTRVVAVSITCWLVTT